MDLKRMQQQQRNLQFLVKISQGKNLLEEQEEEEDLASII